MALTKVSGDILDTGIVVAGVTTSTNFKTGTSNLHSSGIEIAGINVLGADTPIGTGATIYNSGAAVFTGIVTAANYVGTINTPVQPNITSVGTLSALNVSGNVSIGGTLTYEDVTNIDSVGIITARDGLKVLAGGANVVGVVTASAGINVSAGTATFQGAIDANSDLDVDGHTNLDNVSIAGVTTFSGNAILNGTTTFGHDVTFGGASSATALVWDKSVDDLKLAAATQLHIGDSSEFKAYRSGNHTYLDHTNSNGNFFIKSAANIALQAGGSTTGINVNGNGEVTLTNSGNIKLATTATGINITGICTATDFSGAAGGAADFPNGLTGTTATLSGSASVSGDLDVAADIRHIGDENTRISFSSSDTIQLRTGGAARVQIEDGNTTINNNVFLPDNVQLKIGNSVGTPDFKIYHDGNNRLHASNGYMQYRASAHYINDEPNSMNFIRCENSGVKLYYGATARLETKNDGLEVTGNITSNGALTIKTSDVDFVVQDPTDSTTNFIWRDHSASRLYLGVAGIADIMTRSNVSPLGGNNFDLGDTTNRWRNVYTNDLDLSNESKKDEGGNEVDGTWGAYTIQEGESDLFLINRRSGKKYKFNLTEVS